MNTGKLQLEELEMLHSFTRDLNERIVILKYKAYEEKVFGISTKRETEEQRTSNQEIQSVITEMSDFLSNDSSSNHSEVEKETNEVESISDTPSEEPVFGFDLFETKTEPETESAFVPEIKPDMETFSEARPIFYNEPEKEEKTEEATPELPVEVEAETFVEEPEKRIDPVPETPQTSSVAEVDIFRNVQGLDSGSRLMSPKIQTLVGAFGLNEKLQCIRELYNGSSEAFNQAIEKVDNEPNFQAAKSVLAEHARVNSWDLESNLVNEFLQKVERRFL